MQLFQNIDSFYSQPMNCFYTSGGALILSVLLYWLLSDLGYDKAKLIRRIATNYNLRVKYLITIVGITLNNTFTLFCGAKSQEVVQLILTNCVFVSLIFLDKYKISDAGNTKELFLNVLHYICITSMWTFWFLGVLAKNMQPEGLFKLALCLIANFAIIEATTAINFLILFVISLIIPNSK